MPTPFPVRRHRYPRACPHTARSEMIRQIDGKELKSMIDQGADFLLVDARMHEGYEREHIPGAVRMPAERIGEHALREYDKDRTVVTYCTNTVCKSSTIAAEKLERFGFKNVLEYKAGIEDWKRAGYPTEK